MEVVDKNGNALDGIDYNGYRLDKVQEVVSMMEGFLSDVVVKVNPFGDGGGDGGGGEDVNLPFYTKSEIQEILGAYALMGQLSELISTLVSGRITELQSSGDLYGSESSDIITLQSRLENIHKLCYGYGFNGVIDLNYVPYNISIENIKNAVNGLVSSISALNNVVFTQSGNQTQVLNLALKDDVGDIDSLETTNKQSIVGAINELESRQIDANTIFPSGATSGKVLTYNGTSRVWSDTDAKKLLNRNIDISSFTGKNGQVLRYNESENKFELGVVGVSGLLPAGGSAGQVLSKVDGVDYNTRWVNVSNSGGSSMLGFARIGDGINTYTIPSTSPIEIPGSERISFTLLEDTVVELGGNLYMYGLTVDFKFCVSDDGFVSEYVCDSYESVPLKYESVPMAVSKTRINNSGYHSSPISSCFLRLYPGSWEIKVVKTLGEGVIADKNSYFTARMV